LIDIYREKILLDDEYARMPLSAGKDYIDIDSYRWIEIEIYWTTNTLESQGKDDIEEWYSYR